MRTISKSALVFAMGTVTAFALTVGPVSAQDSDKVPVKIALEVPGLTNSVEFEFGLFPFLRDPQTGEVVPQPILSDRVILSPENPRQFKTYTLQQGYQYQFTADIPTASGDLPDFTYALEKSENPYVTTDLSNVTTVVLRLVKTPRNAPDSGTFLDVSNFTGSWELGIYPGPAVVETAHK